MLESHEVSDQHSDLEYCFDKQNVYKRFLIVAAGPVFNLILAIIFFTFVHFKGISGIKPRGSAGDCSFKISATIINKGIAAFLFSVLMEHL